MAGGNPFSQAEDEIIAEVYAAHGGKKGWAIAATKRLPGRSNDSIKQRRLALACRATQDEAEDIDRPEFASPYTTSPLSVDDIVKLFRIDLTVWEAYNVTPNVWQMGAKHPETGELLKQDLYQTKVRFRRIAPPAVYVLKEALLSDIRAETKRRGKPVSRHVRANDDEPHALEVDEFDIHVNKLAWAAETGDNYDSDIAEQRARRAMLDLLAMAEPYHIERMILPVGNDLTNSDNVTGATTAGTRQDTDTRYHRMFRRARGLTSWMIEQCARIAPVEVVIVPGNHDEITAWTIGQVLEAEYATDSRITFQSGPQKRKYVQYGANLIGFTHGHDEPHGNLPQIMAVEQAGVWSQTTHREFHVGHLHKQKATQPIMVDDKIGVTVRIIRALSGLDAWHVGKGYVGTRQGAEAFVWRKSGGLRAHLYHDVHAPVMNVPKRKRA